MKRGCRTSSPVGSLLVHQADQSILMNPVDCIHRSPVSRELICDQLLLVAANYNGHRQSGSDLDEDGKKRHDHF
jgi:hypothetical protein